MSCKRSSLRPTVLRCLAALALAAFSQSAWAALQVSPSPSYDGSYTVSGWTSTLGYSWDDEYPCYPEHWYSLQENGVDVLWSGTSFPVSGKPVGTYTYQVYYRTSVCGSPYDEYPVEGPVTVEVLPPPPSFSIGVAPATAEGDTMVFTVTRSGTTTGSYSVSYNTYFGSGATATTADATPTSGTLTFASGETSKTISVATTEEAIYEANEYFYVVIHSPTGGATITTGTNYGYINNDDAAPSFSIDDTSISEGGILIFTITKNGSTELTHSVNFATATGTAGSSDFQARAETLSFTSGQAALTLSIQTTQDSLYESTERMYVNLSSATGGATIADTQGYGDITNDDAAPSFTINDVSIGEGGTLSFSVTKSGSTALSHDVSYASANGSAASGSDYTAVSGTLTFTSGQTTQAVSVTTADDSTYEGNETVYLNLSSATNGATIGDSQGIGTINENDAGPSFTINDVSIGESGTLAFTVTKSGSTALSHNVSYASANGSAASGSDYTAVSGTLTFTSGQTTQTVNVTTSDDSTYEGNETVNLNLSSATNGATIGDSQGIGTINENDAGPSFTINDVSIGEGGILSFTVTKSGSTALSHNVSYASANGSAASGSDYTAVSGTLTFTSGQTTQTVNVTTADDSTYEGNETVNLNLSSATNGATIGDSQGIGTINENDAGPSFTINDVSIGESGILSFTVTKSGSTALSHNVSYASADSSAVAGSDYTAVSGTLTFTSGQTAQSVAVSTTADSIYEGNEWLVVNLSSATNGATIADANGIGTINEDDPGPSFTINDVSIGEGGTLSFTVTKSGSTALSHNVSYASANGSAASGSDYTAVSGTLTFTSGQTGQTVNVTTAGDSIYEGNETVNLNLSSATNGATIGDSQGVGTINDDDAGPSFTINDVSVSEGGTLSFTVTKSGSTALSHDVSYASANGSAASGSDYTAASGTLTFTSGQTTQTVNVTSADDSIYEGNETVNVNLSSATSGATIADSQGVGTINDNDPGPSFTINDVSIGEGGTLSFTVTKSGSTQLSHNVSYASADSSAVAGSDYTAVSGTLTFTSAQATQVVAVPTTTDSVYEGNELLVVNLSGATSGATIGDASGIGTINDDDAPPSFTINDVSAGEAGVLSFTVTKSGSTAFSHNVTYASADGSATSASDYTAVSGTLTLTSAQATQSVTVQTLADVWQEGNETLTVNLSGATSGATIADAQGSGTIDDGNDDAVTGSALVSAAPNTTPYSPGSTPGGLSVDATGNSNYRLPIAVPPGTAGMEPDLALVYSSGSGNGHVGIGWGVSGLSAITRCAPTLAQDGAVEAIDNDTGDRFCLDGQRLILVSGTYGADGAEYRTEIDQFAQIHSYGAVGSPGSGPQYFRVRTKSGRILYYGNTADSAVEVGPGNNTIRAWAVNKIEDIVGNYMTVTYQDQSSQTDVEPTEITYTMHNTAPGAAAFARVRFEYEAREPYGYTYQGGWAITNTTRRLKSIKTEAIARDPVSGASLGWTLVRDYRLAYDSGLNGVSRLISAQECPAAPALCLPPTTFGWWNSASAPTLAATPVSWPSGALNDYGAPLFGDFNGDGRTDLLMQDETYQPPNSDGVSRMYLANASGVQVETWTAPTGASPNGWHKWDPAPYANLNQLYTGDFNGDGLTDIARVYLNQQGSQYSYYWYDGTVYFYHSTGTSMEPAGSPLYIGFVAVESANSGTFVFSDFNGDGRTDFIFGGSVGIADNNGLITSLAPLPAGENVFSVPGDFNGDGRVDTLVGVEPNWQIRLNNGSGLALAGQFADGLYTPANASPAVADLNGDGLDDIVLMSGTNARAYFSKGDGQVIQAWSQSGVYRTNVGERAYLGDWNNDGRADIAYHNSAGTTLSFYISTTQNQLQLLTTKNWPNPVNGGNYVFSGDWNGDGVTDLWSRQPGSDTVYLSSSTGRDVVDAITDGLGVVSTVGYAPMSDSTVYSKGSTSAAYPQVVVQSTRPLVKTVTTDDGAGGTRSMTYAYERSVADIERRGGYGFAKITVTDNRTNIQEITSYNQAFPFIGMPLSSERRYTGVLLQSAGYTPGGATPTGGIYSPFVQQAITKTYEPDETFTSSAFVAKALTTNAFDAFGNLTSTTVESFETDAQPSGEFKIAVERDYHNDTTNWLIGQLICERTGDPATIGSVRRTVGYEYALTAPYRGLLTKEVVEPGNGDIAEPSGPECVGQSPAGTRENVTSIATYTHDDFGNRLTVTVDDLPTAVPASQPARVTTIAYGESNAAGTVVASNGRFPIQITRTVSSVDHVEQLQYDGRFGAPLQARDANNQVTRWFYDAFGRQETEIRHDDTRTDLYRAWCTTATCPHGGKLKAVERTDGAPPAAVESDRLGRVAASMQVAFGGKTLVSRTEYTNKGEVDRASRPYFHDTGAGSIRWVEYDYDALSRVTSETVPSDTGPATTITVYEPGVPDQYAFRVSTTNAAGQTTHDQYQVRGLIDQVITAAGTGVQSDTKFTYDVFGNVTKARVNGVAANDVDSTFDIRGRKLSTRDPDLAPNSGTDWQYRYFAFGAELRQQTDAKGQVTTLAYDVLGRPTSRTEAEGTTSWFYDAVGKPKGSLDRVEAPGINQYFYYDALTRHYQTTTLVTGTGPGSGSYDVTRSFDSFGRVDTLTYPASTAYPAGLQVRNDFNANGYLYRVKNASTGAAYWTLDAVTAEGQLEQATFGNGLTTQQLYHASSGSLDEIRTGPGGGSTVQNFHFDFSTIGNLAYRADANAGVGERLTAAGAYDAQNRLTSVERVAHTADHASGAVLSTASFTYNALGNLLTKGGITGTYDYTATPQASCPSGYTATPGPHAVRRTGTDASNYRHFCYDGNGNQTQSYNYVVGRVRTQSWTSYNLPASITENGTSITFDYGADRQRFRQVNGFTGTTTIYVEGLFDREVTDATVNDVHYILANGQAVATFSSRSDAVTSTRYLHRDHVGSVTHVTDETGAVVQTLAYDAWGARRNPSDWADYVGQPSAPVLRRPEFTGHEGLHDVGLVHMNGRIYDPKLGRVLSADPYVQFAGDAQSYNRYSYALNNPLAYTDPSGFLAERLCFLSSCGAAGSARVGAIGGPTSRPAIGVSMTVRGKLRGNVVAALNEAARILAANTPPPQGYGGTGTCGSWTSTCWDHGEPRPRQGWFDSTWWMSPSLWQSSAPAVTYSYYAGLIAEGEGVSSGGTAAASTIAANEQNYVGLGQRVVNILTLTGTAHAHSSKLQFDVHQDVIENVLGDLLPEDEIEILRDSQVLADSAPFQTPENAFRHAMRAPWEGLWHARAKSDKFVRNQFERAWNAPSREEALREFGLALHTIQDATSPSHFPWRPWSGQETNAEIAAHVSRELWEPDAGSPLHRATAEAWRWFEEGKLPERDLFTFGVTE